MDGEYEWVSLSEECWTHVSDAEFTSRLKAEDAPQYGTTASTKTAKAKPDPDKPLDPMDERVTVWDSQTGRKITGNAAPMKKNLQKYLKKRPHCELYTNAPHQIVTEGVVTKKRPRSPSPATGGSPAQVKQTTSIPAYKIEDASAGAVSRPNISMPPLTGHVSATQPTQATSHVQQPLPTEIDSESELSIQDDDEV